MDKQKTFSIISLGCFRNTYDSEVFSGRLLKEGFSLRTSGNRCHTLAINTCGFIDKAKQESVDVINEAIDLKASGKVKRLIVFGCLVKRYEKELKKSFPEVDQWLGVEEFTKVSDTRKKIFPPQIDFLKICEGCFNRCSYCAIPLIKGSLKSKPLKAVIEEVKKIEKSGVKELNLIGQDITSWGNDLGKKDNLVKLLKSILKSSKIPWIRLIYTHPRHITDELLDLMGKEKRICNYIDVPIQHINDRILRLMNRKTSKKYITDLISKIRTKVPGCVIRTSIIVGFPSETESEFKELLSFLEQVRFERLGAFAYSREEDTKAYDFPGQVHASTKKRRLNQLMTLQAKIAQTVNERFLGKSLDVLIEDYQHGLYLGRSQFDAYEVDGEVFVHKKNLKIGSFYNVKITDSYGYDLVAE
ncbi:MAG: MiaB/RimO family radical SAM methylthiotransferase [Candidatus Omnitrophica bacterium]|nr:MiaB/RimO family radical SAM methylthiotransferase [Candidatus Omnitrophota bacterium]